MENLNDARVVSGYPLSPTRNTTTNNHVFRRISVDERDSLDMYEEAILAHIQEVQIKLSQIQNEKQEDSYMMTTPSSSIHSRIIMVSNRLPVKLSKDEHTGEYQFSMTSGGLVTALIGIRDVIPFLWIGWLGEEIPKREQEKVRETLLNTFKCIPVFLSKEVASRYYNGFSNDVLWPIFHYVPLPMSRAGSEKKFDSQLWDAYKLANQQFAQVVNSIYHSGDYVWVHDYHLMILPCLLRQRIPDCNIGWFLHTPFPSSEIYRILPVRKRLLQGVLAANLIGFHTYDYARHFLSACSRIVGGQATPKGIDLDNHFATIGVFPIGIDPDYFEQLLKDPKTQSRITQLAEKFKGKKIIIGVDRLDYIKGIPHKLLVMEKFLNEYPEWQDRVVLIQIAVPSRTNVEEYKHLGLQVNELVGRINSTYGNLFSCPIHYINQSIDPLELAALYNIADVCLVTSLRDGMNLVSHEFVICQSTLAPFKEAPGVLILSEFAGSAQSLSGAVRVNPWNTEEVASSLYSALNFSVIERKLRQLKLYSYVTTHTASFWANSFMYDLRYACERSIKRTKLPKLPVHELIQAYKKSKNRLIISDYDGTLYPLQTLPALAIPKPNVMRTLDILSEDLRNRVFIVSGRERKLMQKWFRQKNIGLAAESGFFYRIDSSDQWHSMDHSNLDKSWTEVVVPIMQYFVERTPGSYIETKESSLTWHYRDTDPYLGTLQARDMQINLEDVLGNLSLEVVQGNKTVEIRRKGVNKGLVMEEILRYYSSPECMQERGPIDFVLCAGDDRSDEDMFAALTKCHTFSVDLAAAERKDAVEDWGFQALNRNSCLFTCHIGDGTSQAKYCLDNVSELSNVLHELSEISLEQKAKGTHTFEK